MKRILFTPTINDFINGFKYLVRGFDIKNWTDAREHTYPELPYNATGKDPITYLEGYLKNGKIKGYESIN